MSELVWKPQESFAEFFNTCADEIIAQRSVFNPNIEYFVPYGGRGSAKTWSFCDAVIIECSLRPVRVLVAREFQESIKESIKAELEEAITNRGLDHFFKCYENKIVAKNGSEIIFKGIKNNIKSIKSISNVDIVICEEAEDITQHSWDKFLPSIRPRDQVTRGGAPIIIVIFNPNKELDDTYQRFIVNPPTNCTAKLLNYYDNKYFPPHLERQRADFERTRPKADYEHEWLGKPKGAGPDVIIDIEWVKAARWLSRNPDFTKEGERVVGYDPAGQGKDSNAVAGVDGNILDEIDEWVLSDDLREASKRAFAMAVRRRADRFAFDECGGLGDGAAVFVGDEAVTYADDLPTDFEVTPFNAGDGVFWADQPISNTGNPKEGKVKAWGDVYSNAKAQAHGIVAQKLYNSYRFGVLGHRDIEMTDLLSIDIEDDAMFNKLAREASTPLWIKSKTNSKKRVEDKKDMKKRTGQESPNVWDSLITCYAPFEIDELKAMLKAMAG